MLPGGSVAKNPLANEHRRHRSDPWVRKPLKETATRASILAGKAPWTEEPGGYVVHGVPESWAPLSD